MNQSSEENKRETPHIIVEKSLDKILEVRNEGEVKIIEGSIVDLIFCKAEFSRKLLLYSIQSKEKTVYVGMYAQDNCRLKMKKGDKVRIEYDYKKIIAQFPEDIHIESQSGEVRVIEVEKEWHKIISYKKI